LSAVDVQSGFVFILIGLAGQVYS